jgi:hypothetical protein
LAVFACAFYWVVKNIGFPSHGRAGRKGRK